MKLMKLLILAICGVLFLATLNSYAKRESLRKQTVKTEALHQEMVMWEKIVSVSPTYRDAYIQLAVGYQQLGETEKAKVFLKKVFETDPNWQVPTELMARLPLLP